MIGLQGRRAGRNEVGNQMKSHKSKMPIYECRLAKRADAAAIFDVLEEVAPEIPVRLDTPNRKELLFKRIQSACVYRTVWIAEICRENQIVGFLMAEWDGQRLDLSYGGVRADHRGQHIFPTLMKKIMAKGVPLTATVMHSNKSDMLSRLLKLSFTEDYSLNDRDFLRWQP
jgi:hypothetical protein